MKKEKPICRHCHKPLRYDGQIECQHCGKVQYSDKKKEETLIRRQADKLLEHCGHCPEDAANPNAVDPDRMRDLIRKFIMSGYDLETAKAMAYQAYHEDPNVAPPPKASFYASDGGMSGGGGGITSA